MSAGPHYYPVEVKGVDFGEESAGRDVSCKEETTKERHSLQGQLQMHV